MYRSDLKFQVIPDRMRCLFNLKILSIIDDIWQFLMQSQVEVGSLMFLDLTNIIASRSTWNHKMTNTFV
jgi:hypothetical protein